MKRAIKRQLKRGEWGFRILTRNMRDLPDFIIVGGQKCGTTSLHAYLETHPRIEKPFKREVHYFDLNYHRGEGWYRSYFPLKGRMKPGNSGAGELSLTCESSPYYIFHPRSAARIRGLNPDMKLIALLRDPVSRAYSHYQHNREKERKPLSFEDGVAAEEERLEGEEAKMMNDPDYYSYSHQHFSYLSRGIYIDQLEKYKDFIERGNFLIIKSEDFFENTRAVYEKVLNSLGLDEWKLEDTDPRNIGKYKKKEPGIFAELRNYFEPYNRALYEYLQRDFGW